MWLVGLLAIGCYLAVYMCIVMRIARTEIDNLVVVVRLLFVIIFVLMQGCATGSFILENDTLAGDIAEQSDRNFTQSTAISYETEYGNTPAGKMHRKFHHLIPFFNQDCDDLPIRTTDHIAVTAFTPDDLEEEEPAALEGDRPYASLLAYGSTDIRTCGKYKGKENEAVDKRGFHLGVLGLNIARDAQRWLHNDAGFSNQDPRGWGTQISDGGELTFLYTWERMYLLGKDKRDREDRRWDLSWTNGINVGYYTNALFGFDVRGGILRSDYWQTGGSHLAAGTEGIPGTSSRLSAGGKERKCFWLVKTDKDCFAFFNARIRSVIYNALLTGQFRSSDYELDTQDVIGVVGQATAGLSIDSGWTFFGRTDRTRFTLAVHARSPEYDSDIHKRTHYWGGFYISTGYSN